MADMEVDPPVATSSGPAAGKKKKQEGPRFEVKKVSLALPRTTTRK